MEQQFAWVETYNSIDMARLRLADLGPLFLCPTRAVISRMNADVETLCLRTFPEEAGTGAFFFLKLKVLVLGSGSSSSLTGL